MCQATETIWANSPLCCCSCLQHGTTAFQAWLSRYPWAPLRIYYYNHHHSFLHRHAITWSSMRWVFISWLKKRLLKTWWKQFFLKGFLENLGCYCAEHTVSQIKVTVPGEPWNPEHGKVILWIQDHSDNTKKGLHSVICMQINVLRCRKDHKYTSSGLWKAIFDCLKQRVFLCWCFLFCKILGICNSEQNDMWWPWLYVVGKTSLVRI